MRKFLVILFAIFIGTGNIALADGDDLWDNFGDQNVYGQKPVSEQEFEKALESKKGKKKRDKNIPKGESFQQSNETEILSKSVQELPVLLVPLNLQVNNQSVPIGHYQVIGEKKDGKTHIKLYQSHYLIADIPAIETNDDFNEQTISFVKLSQYSTKQVKIIFGNVDFNAYAIVNIADGE